MFYYGYTYIYAHFQFKNGVKLEMAGFRDGDFRIKAPTKKKNIAFNYISL